MQPMCPHCGQALKRLTDSSAGDWFCVCHNNYRANRPYAYFWDSEISQERVCSCCGDITINPSVKYCLNRGVGYGWYELE
jgi:hypothetical protein